MESFYKTYLPFVMPHSFFKISKKNIPKLEQKILNIHMDSEKSMNSLDTIERTG